MLRKRKFKLANNPNYRSFKPNLRIEFDHECNYCGIRECEGGGSKKFQIDHYKPQRYKASIGTYTNLFYTCSECNRQKWDYWPNLAQRVLGEIILNSFKDDVDKHIDKSNSGWTGKTAQGAFNVLRLRLDSAANRQRREDRDEMQEMLNESLQNLEYADGILTRALKSTTDQGLISAAKTKVIKAQRRVDTLRRL